MSQIKLLIGLALLAAFLGLGWAYQDAAGDAQKYKDQNTVLKNDLKEAKDANDKLDKADKVDDKISAESIQEKTVVAVKIDNSKNDVKTQIFKIDKEFKLANKDKTTVFSTNVLDTKERDDKVSKVLITSLWDTYCDGNNDSTNCATPTGETS